MGKFGETRVLPAGSFGLIDSILLFSGSFASSSSQRGTQVAQAPIEFSQMDPIAQSETTYAFLGDKVLADVVGVAPAGGEKVTAAGADTRLGLVMGTVVVRPVAVGKLLEEEQDPVLVPF